MRRTEERLALAPLLVRLRTQEKAEAATRLGIPLQKAFSIAARSAASLFLIGAGLWSALALFYLARSGLLASCAALATIPVALWALWGGRLWGLLPAALAGGLALVLFYNLHPSHDRTWSPDVAYLATGKVKGDGLIMDHVRTFRWRADDTAEPVWNKRVYDLDTLTSVDLIASYWMGEPIAHTMLSFGFTQPDGRIEHLVFSAEIRKEKGEQYSAIAGFFRQYELAIIAADEIDIIGVRAQVRSEDVRIYPLAMPKATARELLLHEVALANRLKARPKFYNTITANCTTVPFHLARLLVPGLPLDWRILASGYFPDYLYKLGAIPNAVPFSKMRALAPASERAKDALSTNAPNFSTAIRAGLPKAELF